MREPAAGHDLAADAPICRWCGVTALPGAAVGRPTEAFVCDNPDCPGFGEPVSD